MRYLIKYKSSALLVLILLLNACIGENQGICYPDQGTVKINFTANSGCPDIQETLATTNLRVFIFNSDGLFLQELGEELTSLSLNTSYSFPYNLAAGKYRFIAVAGMGDGQLIKEPKPGVDSFNDFVVSGFRRENGRILQAASPLYQGFAAEVQLSGGTADEVTINLVQQVKPLSVKVDGLSSPAQYTLTISGNLLNYTFDNSGVFVDGDIKVPLVADANGTGATANTMICWPIGSTTMVTLKNEQTGAIFFQSTLQGLFSSGGVTNPGCQAAYELKLKYDANLLIGVSINGWNVNNSSEEI